MNKIVDGLLYGIGATIAFHLMGFLLTLGMWAVFTIISLLTANSPGDFM